MSLQKSKTAIALLALMLSLTVVAQVYRSETKIREAHN